MKELQSDCFFPNIFNKKFKNTKYYRYLGQEKSRKNPTNLPSVERQFFNACKLLTLNSEGFIGKKVYIPELLFSRFFTDTHSFHFDIGFRDVVKVNDKRNLNKFAKKFIMSPFFLINNRCSKNSSPYNLIGLMEEIKQIYLYATKSKRIQLENNYSNNVILGSPALFITYDKKENHSFGKANEIILDSGIKILHNFISIDNNLVDVWYIGVDKQTSHDQELRNLRIYLSKLHSYKETTRIIINHICNYGSESLDMHKVMFFLELMLDKINKKFYYGFDSNDFWELIFNIDNKYNNVTWIEFKDCIKAIIEELKMSKNNEYKQIINNSSFINSPVTNGSDNEVLEISENLDQLIKDFDSIFSSIINKGQLTEEQTILISNQIDTFKDYVLNAKAEKSFSEKLLDNIKKSFKFTLANSESIKQLVDIGIKISSLI